LGYRISVPTGKLAGANQPPHFYMRIVPKYKKDWGSRGDRRTFKKQASVEKMEELEKIFQPNSKGIVNEKNKTIAKIHNEVGAFVISTKNHLPNDINSIDPET